MLKPTGQERYLDSPSQNLEGRLPLLPPDSYAYVHIVLLIIKFYSKCTETTWNSSWMRTMTVSIWGNLLMICHVLGLQALSVDWTWSPSWRPRRWRSSAPVFRCTWVLSWSAQVARARMICSQVQRSESWWSAVHRSPDVARALSHWHGLPARPAESTSGILPASTSTSPTLRTAESHNINASAAIAMGGIMHNSHRRW